MREGVFGRTNRQFPDIWLSLQVPERGGAQELMQAALSTKTPIEIASLPALFGSFLPRESSAELIQLSSLDIERAVDSKHAADLLQAHLIQTLSSMGRPYVDFYFLRSRIAYEEAQISGALEALESARQEGHIRYLGLRVENVAASIGNWQFHDGFDVVSAPDELSCNDLQQLQRMAASRRVGFLLRSNSLSGVSTLSEKTIVTVSSAQEIAELRVA